MVDWNPGTPDALGLQLAPLGRDSLASPLASKALTSTTTAAVQSLPSTATETITEVSAFLIESGSGLMLWEALADGQVAATGHGSQIFRPNGAFGISLVENEVGSTVAADLVASINEATLDELTWITATGAYGSTAGGQLDLEFPTAAALAGKRITGVTAHFVIGRAPASAGATVNVALAPAVGFQSFWGGATANVYEVNEHTADSGEINQTTEQPWTVADIQGFDSGNGIRLFGFMPGVFIYQVWIEVFYCDENRLARVAFDVVSGTGPAWRTFAPQNVDGVAGWAKVAATDAVMVLRRPNTSAILPAGSASAPYISSLGDQPLASSGIDWYGGAVVEADGTFSLIGLPVSTRLMPIVLATGAAQSVDSQPYAVIGEVSVTSALSPEQDITGAVETYGGVIVPLGVDVLSGDLTVTLVRRSDAAVMATGSISAADALLLPEATLGSVASYWRLALIEFTAPVLLAAVEYGVIFSTSAGTWTLPTLTNDDGSATWLSEVGAGGEASYGGETVTLWESAAADVLADLPVLVFVSPDPVTGLAATAATIPTGATGECPVTGIGYVQISWDASGLGADFRRYELQRYDADPATSEWVTIAVVTDEALTGFVDVEARLGVSSCYRVRVIRDSDGIPSLWSDEDCAIAPVEGCELTFTTNEDTAQSLAYADVYDRVAERSYEFPEAEEVQVRQLYGRDYQVAFHPLERRGVGFTRTLILAGLVIGGRVGPPVADALRDLAVAPVSYVCVRDSDGNRWFGSIRIPSLAVRQPGAFHWCQLIFIETTATPSTPDGVTLPPGPPVALLFVSGDPFLFVDGSQAMSVSS